MRGSEYFEEISAGAISPQMPPCKAIIINVGNKKEICTCLKELYSSLNYKVYLVNVTSAKLKQTLERCAEAGIVAIVNCSKELPGANIWNPQQQKYAAALVSPDSNSCAPFLEDNNLHTFSNIGFQGYRYDPAILSQLQARYFEDMRLGTIRENITLCEPLVRDADYAFIDMRSVRYSDFPYSNSANPNGLYAEEICTIARYIGLAKSLKAVFIYGLPSTAELLTVCNKLVAETIWHLCEGIASNIPEDPANEEIEECFQKNIVSMGENGENITFITSCTTHRWWMEIPVKENSSTYIPCSIEDYKTACNGEVPLKWLFFYQKYAFL